MRIDEFAAKPDASIDIRDKLRIATVGFDLLLVYQGQIVLPANPVISLQYSSDGGYTWSDEVPRSLGNVGEHKKVIYWDRLGKARDRVFRVVISEPVKIVIVGAWVDSEDGLS